MPLNPYTNFDWVTGVITIPQSYMTFQGGNVYQLDVEQLKLDIAEVLATEVGMVFADAFTHATEQTISGILFARGVNFLAPYSFTITPDGGWIVSCSGANHNIQDLYNNLTGPTLLPNLSAGLIKDQSVSGLTAAESAQLDTIHSQLPGMATDISSIQGDVLAIEANVAILQTDLGLVRVDITQARKILRNKKISFKSGANAGKAYIWDDVRSVSITRVGSLATVTDTNHDYATGKIVEIAGADQSEYNGEHTITVIDQNTYSFAVTGTPATPATGSPTATAILMIADIWEDDQATQRYRGQGAERQDRYEDAP